MRSCVRRAFLLALNLLTAVLLTATYAQGDTKAQRDMAKEKVLWDQLNSISPSAVEPFKAATSDLDNEDYEGAAVGFREVLVKAPGFDAAVRRLGIALVWSGKPDEGKRLLESLVGKDRSPENLGTFANALGFPPNGATVSRADKQHALSLAAEADNRAGSRDEYYTLMVAQLALDLRDYSQFHEATESLVRYHQDLMQTHYFAAIDAAMNGHWTIAKEEISQAKALGLSPEVAQKLLAAEKDSDQENNNTQSAARSNYEFYGLYACGVWIIGLVLLFVLGKALSVLTLRSIEMDDPNKLASQGHGLRTIYRLLMNAAELYYYASIPVVICLLLALAGSVVYWSFVLGHVPVKLMAVIVVGALVTAFKMVQSLFVKRGSTDPGRAILPAEAPGLWDLARDVAKVVGTRTVDEIRLTPGVDLAVYENRSEKSRSGDGGKRVLLLGAGVLNRLSLNAFRAVLAHEYGHLSHRDTAGGEVALQVNANMTKFAVAMVRSGQAVWWNLGFRFLRVYHFIFRRLSHGATRLQEVMADRVAVLNYGASAFEEGLRHVIRQAVEFEEAASSEIRDARMTRRALRNLYDLDSVRSAKTEGEVLAATNRTTTEDDTHPSPLDRFRYARRIISKPVTPIEGTVWDLFVDREALTMEMSNMVGQRVQSARR